MIKKTDLLKLIIAIALPLLAGFIGSYFTAPSIPEWYMQLNKPALNPPGWIFAPVWTVLYITMGVSLFLVWKEKNVNLELGVFVVQLFLNSAWSIIFFGMQNPGLALANIIILWMAIVLTLVLFYRVARLAAYLLVPYLLWVSFAIYLNYGILILN